MMNSDGGTLSDDKDHDVGRYTGKINGSGGKGQSLFLQPWQPRQEPLSDNQAAGLARQGYPQLN